MSAQDPLSKDVDMDEFGIVEDDIVNSVTSMGQKTLLSEKEVRALIRKRGSMDLLLKQAY